jgi:hypothetical protein
MPQQGRGVARRQGGVAQAFLIAACLHVKTFRAPPLQGFERELRALNMGADDAPHRTSRPAATCQRRRGPGLSAERPGSSGAGCKRSATVKQFYSPVSAAEAWSAFRWAAIRQRRPVRCLALGRAARTRVGFDRSATARREPGREWPGRCWSRPSARCRSMPIAGTPSAVRRRGCARAAGRRPECARAGGQRPASWCPSWSAPLLPVVRFLQWRFTDHRASSVGLVGGWVVVLRCPGFPDQISPGRSLRVGPSPERDQSPVTAPRPDPLTGPVDAAIAKNVARTATVQKLRS